MGAAGCDARPWIAPAQRYGRVGNAKGLRFGPTVVVVNGPGLVEPGVRLTGWLLAARPPAVKCFMAQSPCTGSRAALVFHPAHMAKRDVPMAVHIRAGG